MENLYETREGVAKLATALVKALNQIEAAKKKGNGHIPTAMSGPNDVKYAAIEALGQCVRRGIVPPPRLVALIRRLLGVGNESRRRDRVRAPVGRLIRIMRSTGLSGRALAREARSRGIDVSDNTVRRVEQRLLREREELQRAAPQR
jgi:hypothetical protein